MRDGRGLLLTGRRGSEVPLAELEPLWQGEYAVYWRPPEGYAAPFGIGQRGAVVGWLAAEFAALDGQDRPLAGTEFNAALDARVRLFQRRHGLDDDGVVEVRTLLKLESARDAGAVRLSRTDGPPEGGG